MKILNSPAPKTLSADIRDLACQLASRVEKRRAAGDDNAVDADESILHIVRVLLRGRVDGGDSDA